MRVLVVYYAEKSTFIQRDIDILSKHFDVDEISIRKARDIITLAKKVKNSDVIFVWFAGKHAGISVFLARWFRKKSIVVVGGYDVAKVPEINYGLWAVGSLWDKTLAKYALKNADAVISVSKSLVNNLRKYVNIKRKILVVPTGYDSSFWKPSHNEKEDMVLTVALINREERIKLKGIDLFLKVAKNCPYLEFLIIGVKNEMRGKIGKLIESKNVKILPPLPPSELRKYYQKAKVFALLSLSEGLPNTLCEAMLCGCVPVVTNVGAMPNVVGEYGFIVNRNEQEICQAIKKAISLSPKLSKKAREKIIREFSIGTREIALKDLINTLSEEDKQ